MPPTSQAPASFKAKLSVDSTYCCAVARPNTMCTEPRSNGAAPPKPIRWAGTRQIHCVVALGTCCPSMAQSSDRCDGMTKLERHLWHRRRHATSQCCTSSRERSRLAPDATRRRVPRCGYPARPSTAMPQTNALHLREIKACAGCSPMPGTPQRTPRYTTMRKHRTHDIVARSVAKMPKGRNAEPTSPHAALAERLHSVGVRGEVRALVDIDDGRRPARAWAHAQAAKDTRGRASRLASPERETRRRRGGGWPVAAKLPFQTLPRRRRRELCGSLPPAMTQDSRAVVPPMPGRHPCAINACLTYYMRRP